MSLVSGHQLAVAKRSRRHFEPSVRPRCMSFAVVQAQLKEKLFLWFMQTSDVTPWLEDPRGGDMPFGPHTAAGKPADVAADTAPIEQLHVWH